MPVAFSKSSQLAKDIVAEVLGADMPVGTILKSVQTSEGEEAVRIVLIFPEIFVKKISGEQALSIMGKLRSRLSEIGEERQPIISFSRMREEPEPISD